MKSTMPDGEAHVTFSSVDYEAIEAAVLETSRGRWFLREYARRNRNADTQAVLAAIAGLEKRMADEQTARTMDQIRASLLDMAGAIEDTKAEIGPDRNPGPAAEAPDTGAAERRIARILETLRYLEQRIQAMMTLCEPPLEAGLGHPGPDGGTGMTQADLRPGLLN
ncbi:FUSC family protein [Microvirga rosea]|uniref:FUSC family protein n=1 Tax=Microvirga rosea TaxID=2715425 RepID=UPI001D0B6683|nr:FUSC family protein [Microvirga rosea]MCB8821179.1 FUSC family protein [Microvirga rosea]